MANLSHDSSGLTESTNSTIYTLEDCCDPNSVNKSKSNALNGSADSSGVNDSSHGSNISFTDSCNALDEFPGFSEADATSESDMKDPFNSIFYHVMPLKDSTNIIFYNKVVYNNVLSVLSKEFNFPSKDAKKFHIKTHVDGKRCSIQIDREVMSMCASGPGHTFWKENNFKKLSENMYRCFIRETNSVLNTHLQEQHNQSLSVSQQSGLITLNTTDEAGDESPGAVLTQQPPETSAGPQDSQVIRKITILMDMIKILQGQITSLTSQVNDLVSQAVYRTVDETHTTDSSRETVIHTVNESEISQQSDDTTQPPAAETPSINSYSQALQQTDSSRATIQHNHIRAMGETPHSGSNVPHRTSTPKTPNQRNTDRSHADPRLISQPCRPESHPRAGPAPSGLKRNTSKILFMGDSLISSVNPRGLKQGVFKHSIPGARIDHIFDQTNVFNMQQFSQVIISVGGNDASNNTDVEYFEELYEQVIQNLKQANGTCQIYLCSVSPRGDTDTNNINEAIHRLCRQHNITMVDISEAFHNKRGMLIERYYAHDLIHLSASGVKRLLGEIDKSISIVANFENCVFKGRYQKKGSIHRGKSQTNTLRSNHGQTRVRSSQNSKNNIEKMCYKCGETNHDTSQCKHKVQLKCFYCGYYGHKSGRCHNI